MVADLKLLPSIHGTRMGLSRTGSLIHDGRMMLPTWRDRGLQVEVFDHFLGNSLLGTWINTLKGSDAACAVPVIHNDQVGGRVRLTTGAGAGATMAVNGSQLVGNKNFDVTKGHLEFASAAQMAAITSICMFIGFADSDALQMPFTIAGGTLTNNCTDGHGFLFDTAATAATWKIVGCANGTKAPIIDTGKAPVAGTDDLFRTEIDTAGNLTAFLNDVVYATSAPGYGYSTAGNLLTPTVAVFRRSAASTTVDVDFISAIQDR